MSSLRKHKSSQSKSNHHHMASMHLGTNPFMKLQSDVNHAMSDFYNFLQPFNEHFEKFDHMMLTPALDMVEDAKCFKIEAEMPGMGEEDISLYFDHNRLTIEGEKTTSKKDSKKNFVNREISYGHYQRSINLPDNADVSKASASFKKGMLWVIIPKKAAMKSPKKALKISKAE